MINDHSYGKHRLLEIAPGAIIWLTFVLALVSSIFAPVAAIIFIIIFDLYWTIRVFYFIFFVILSWKKFNRYSKKDWAAEIRTLNNSARVYHLVFLPTYKEDYEIVSATFDSFISSQYDKKKIIVVLAGEERDKNNFEQVSKKIIENYGNLFHKLIFTLHPAGLSGEIPGKGSNLHWSGHKVKEIIDSELRIPYEDIVVSALDVDTIVHSQYFAYLTYLFCTVSKPHRTSYQPLALYSNNIWDSPAPVRIAAFGTTFWLLTELTRPDRMWTFSSHAMSWKMLVDVDFWQKDIVSEDSRIFLQAFLHYHGDYKVEPMYINVNLDAVSGSTYVDSLKALYKQQRRWAWGVEHLPVMYHCFKEDDKIPKIKKAKFLFNHIEGMYTWATAPIIIFIMGQLPMIWTSGTFESSSLLIQNAPFTLEWLMRFAMLGIFVSCVLAIFMLPKRPKTKKSHAWAVMILQWALLPVTSILFGALPAVDAQTRLMLGRYLGFNVTQKKRQ